MMKKTMLFIVIGMILLVGTAFAVELFSKEIYIENDLYSKLNKETFNYNKTDYFIANHSRVCIISNQNSSKFKCGIYQNSNIDNGIKQLATLYLNEKYPSATPKSTEEGSITLVSDKSIGEIVK